MAESSLAGMKVTVRHVLPSFNTTVTKYVSMVTLVCGALLVIFGATVFGIHGYPSVGGTSMLAAVGLFGTGALGLLASLKFRKEVWAVSVLLLLSICGLAFCLALFGASVLGTQREADRNPHYSAPRAAREALDIVCLVLSLCGAGACGVLIGLCIQALYWACCRRRSGVTYVDNNTNQVIAESPATPGQIIAPSGEHISYTTSSSDNNLNHPPPSDYSNNNTHSLGDAGVATTRDIHYQVTDSQYAVLDI